MIIAQAFFFLKLYQISSQRKKNTKTTFFLSFILVLLCSQIKQCLCCFSTWGKIICIASTFNNTRILLFITLLTIFIACSNSFTPLYAIHVFASPFPSRSAPKHLYVTDPAFFSVLHSFAKFLYFFTSRYHICTYSKSPVVFPGFIGLTPVSVFVVNDLSTISALVIYSDYSLHS